MNISHISSRLILNSQGRKAIECTVSLDDGSSGTFAPPAGTSVGKYEAKTVDAATALEQVSKVTQDIKQLSNPDQDTLDDFLNQKDDLGANSTLAISISFAIATKSLSTNFVVAQLAEPKKKPQLMVLFFEGGVHASSNISIQEFMVIYDNIFKAAEDYNNLKKKLEKDGYRVNSGMEGGMVSNKLTEEKIYTLLKDRPLALDIGGSYLAPNKGISKRPALPKGGSTVSIEDPYSEDEVEKWKEFYKNWHDKLMIVGDDLTVTNKDRIKKFANNAINAVIIKPNQQRTLTDTLEAIKTAREHNLKIIISHRSGETNQTFVSDLALAVNADYVKFGAPARGERVVKYNRLLELTNK